MFLTKKSFEKYSDQYNREVYWDLSTPNTSKTLRNDFLNDVEEAKKKNIWIFVIPLANHALVIKKHKILFLSNRINELGLRPFQYSGWQKIPQDLIINEDAFELLR